MTTTPVRLSAARARRIHQDPRVVPLRLDVTDPASIRDAVERAGDVDLLINNAGIAGNGSLSQLLESNEDFKALTHSYLETSAQLAESDAVR